MGLEPDRVKRLRIQLTVVNRSPTVVKGAIVWTVVVAPRTASFTRPCTYIRVIVEIQTIEASMLGRRERRRAAPRSRSPMGLAGSVESIAKRVIGVVHAQMRR